MTIDSDLGVAFGLVVRSMGAMKSIGAGFMAMRQGEVTQYTELLEDSCTCFASTMRGASWTWTT